MAEFSPVQDGIQLTLDHAEADVLRNLVDDLKLLLKADVAEPDPVVERLFPPAYDDPDDQRAYSELIGGELRSTKLQMVEVVEKALGARGPVAATLAPDEADPWLACLADLRLAIGTRLEVTEEDMAREVDPVDANASAMLVLHWLSYLQGSLLESLGWTDHPQWLQEEA